MVATTLLEGDRQFNVVCSGAKQYRNTLEAVSNIKVGALRPNGTNAYIPLRELADIKLETGASYIYHEGGERYIPVKFSVRGRDLGGAVAETQQRIANNVRLPTGYRIVWAGEFEDLHKAQARLAVIVPLSLGLILVLLYGLFNSLRDSLMALAGIPFAAGGGVLALYLIDLNFSISAAIGFVSLFGVSVMNGILIIIYYNEIKAGAAHARRCFMPHSADAADADDGDISLHRFAARGDLERIGSQVQRPLATVVVGGMLIGPIILLVVLPALQTLFLDGVPQVAPPVEPDAPRRIE